MSGLPYPIASLGLGPGDVEANHMARLDAAEASARNCGVGEKAIQTKAVDALAQAGVPRDDPDFLEFVVAGYEDGLALACRRRRAIIYASATAAAGAVLWAGWQLIRRT